MVDGSVFFSLGRALKKHSLNIKSGIFYPDEGVTYENDPEEIKKLDSHAYLIDNLMEL
jgi:hypothetical protein